MNKTKLLITILLTFATIINGCSSNKENKSSEQQVTETKTENKAESKQAYNFTALDVNGNEVKLENFKGKKVYINVWASWCGPCKKEMPELEKVYNKLKDKTDFTFLSITSPSDEQFKNQHPADKSKNGILTVAKELGVTYPILFDVNDRFLINYAIRAFPTHIFINSDGTVKVIPGIMSSETLEQHISELK